MGRTVAGDDTLGLTRSFYLAGALAVLSSLWPVDDAGTKFFMTTFHKYAAKGHYGGAWLAARNAARKRGFPPSVYGAFVLGGAIKG
jgi:CHAT domain-containing protein